MTEAGALASHPARAGRRGYRNSCSSCASRSPPPSLSRATSAVHNVQARRVHVDDSVERSSARIAGYLLVRSLCASDALCARAP